MNTTDNGSEIFFAQVFNSGKFNLQNSHLLSVEKPSYLLSFKTKADLSVLNKFHTSMKFVKPVDSFLDSNIIFIIVIIFVTTYTWGLIFTNILFNNTNNSLNITVYLDNYNVGNSKIKQWFVYTKSFLMHVVRSLFKNEMTVSLGCYIWALCIFLTRLTQKTLDLFIEKQYQKNYTSFNELLAKLYSDNFNLFSMVFIQLLYVLVFVQFVYDCCHMLYSFEKTMNQNKKRQISIATLTVFVTALLVPNFICEMLYVILYSKQAKGFAKMISYFETKNGNSGLKYSSFTVNDVDIINKFFSEDIFNKSAFACIWCGLLSSIFNFIAIVSVTIFVFLPTLIIAQRKLHYLEATVKANLHRDTAVLDKTRCRFDVWRFCKKTLPVLAFNVVVTLCLLLAVLLNIQSLINQFSFHKRPSILASTYEVVDAITGQIYAQHETKAQNKQTNKIPDFLRWVSILVYFFQLIMFVNYNSVLSILKTDLKYYEVKYSHLPQNDEEPQEDSKNKTTSTIVNPDLATMSVLTFTTKRTKGSKVSMFKIPNLLDFHLFEDHVNHKSDSDTAVQESADEVVHSSSESSGVSEYSLPIINHDMTDF